MSFSHPLACWLDRERALAAARSIDEQRAAALALPTEVDPLPEVHAIQTRLLLRAWPLLDQPRLPPWRAAGLPAASRLAWARLSLLVAPADSRDLPDTGLPWPVVLDGLDLMSAPDPLAVIAVLFSTGDEAAQRRATEALREAVVRGYAAVGEVSALLTGLLDAHAPALRAAALRSLGQPWAWSLPVGENPLQRALSSPSEADALAALEVAGQRGLLRLIAPLVSEGPLRLRQEAARWVGRLGDREAIDTLLERGLAAPGWMGSVALEALVTLHHRGHFVRDEQVADVLNLLSAGARLPPPELAGLLFVGRRAFVENISTLDPDDPDWRHLLPVAAALLLAPRPPEGLLAQLARVATHARRVATAQAALQELHDLAVDASWLPRAPLEQAALARLSDHPGPSLDLLDLVGEQATRDELTDRLRLPHDDPRALPVRSWNSALAVLWQLSSHDERLALLARVDPAQLPAGALASLTPQLSPEQREAALLRAGADSIETSCEALCGVAEPEELPLIERALLRVAEKAAQGPVDKPSARSFRDAATPATYGEEAQQLPPGVVAAVEAMGKRWSVRHRRPACLRSWDKRLLAELTLGLLRRDPPAAVQAVLLRTLLSHDHPATPAVAAVALGHRDHHVAKLAARLLARRGGAWLSRELVQGAAARDERRSRACMEALASEGGPAAEPTALGFLERPNMNLKKIGTAALEKVGTAASAPALLGWLGRHDNPGFRVSLIAALRRALGVGYLAGLLAAIEAVSTNERSVRLLIEALDAQLDPPLVRSLLARSPGWSRALLEALSAGTIRLRAGSLADLADGLTAARLPVPEQTPRPPRLNAFTAAADALATQGWSAERAEAVLEAWPSFRSPDDIGKFRIYTREWLAWMMERQDTRPAPLVNAVLGSPTPLENALIDRATPGLLALLTAAEPARRAALFPLLERLAGRLDPPGRLDLGQQVRAVLGATPGLDASPLPLLTRCGLLLTRADVERALDGVDGVPNPITLRRTILQQAFGTTGAPLSPREQLSLPIEDPDAPPGSAGPEPRVNWAALLDAALRAEGSGHIEKLRIVWPLPPAVTLGALVRELPQSSPGARGAALDWMESLRPIGVERWSWPEPPAREEPDPTRAWAAPEPRSDHEGQLERLGAWLRVQSWTGEGAQLASYLPEEVIALATTPEARRRLMVLIAGSPQAVAAGYRGWLEAQWEASTEGDRAHLTQALEQGQREAKSRWVPPGWYEQQRAKREALWATPLAVPSSASEADQDERAQWYEQARGADPEAARLALTRLSEEPDERWRELVMSRAEQGERRVRLHALRLIRKTLPREDGLAAARWFLDDEEPGLRRMAIRSVCHGRDPSSLPRIAALLLDPVAWVRKEALAGLELYGEGALPWVKRARAQSRPDEARRLDDALRRLAQGGQVR